MKALILVFVLLGTLQARAAVLSETAVAFDWHLGYESSLEDQNIQQVEISFKNLEEMLELIITNDEEAQFNYQLRLRKLYFDTCGARVLESVLDHGVRLVVVDHTENYCFKPATGVIEITLESYQFNKVMGQDFFYADRFNKVIDPNAPIVIDGKVQKYESAAALPIPAIESAQF